jgi:hypothetical protein
MKRSMVVPATALALLGMVPLTACNSGEREDGDTEVVTENAEPEAVAERLPPIEREFWMAIAENPGLHLNEARTLLVARDARGAAAELLKVAAQLRFETRHSSSPNEARPLLVAVEQLERVANLIRFEEEPGPWTGDIETVDRVSAQTYQAMGTHHLALARENLEEGDFLMSGLYMQESAKDIRQGFARAEVDPGALMEKDFEDARNLAGRLVREGKGDRDDAQAALGSLADALDGLGEVLGSRREETTG